MKIRDETGGSLEYVLSSFEVIEDEIELPRHVECLTTCHIVCGSCETTVQCMFWSGCAVIIECHGCPTACLIMIVIGVRDGIAHSRPYPNDSWFPYPPQTTHPYMDILVDIIENAKAGWVQLTHWPAVHSNRVCLYSS